MIMLPSILVEVQLLVWHLTSLDLGALVGLLIKVLWFLMLPILIIIEILQNLLMTCFNMRFDFRLSHLGFDLWLLKVEFIFKAAVLNIRRVVLVLLKSD
jgi:hypothetical protein